MVEAAFTNDTPSGDTSTPGIERNGSAAASVTVERLNTASAPGSIARFVYGRARTPEVPSRTRPSASPASTVDSTATRATTAPTSTNRRQVRLRSRQARNTVRPP